MSKTMILAGNALEARNYAEQNAYRPSEYRYIGSADALRGCCTNGTPRLIVGTFNSRRDAHAILDTLHEADRYPQTKHDSAQDNLDH